MPALFDLQGHRGARGLRFENTLPSFEAALDAGVSSVETDLHLTADGAVVLCHDPVLDARVWGSGARVRSLRLADLRRLAVAGSPEPTPLAAAFAAARGVDPYAVPTLDDLFAFAAAYAADGKADGLRERAARVQFDLEFKGVPFEMDASAPGELVWAVVAAVRAAGLVERCRVRSFDHRSVRAATRLEPRLTGAVLVADTAVVDPGAVARAAGATLYCPDYRFLDADLVRAAHDGGARVLPWTVNDLGDCARLLDWGVDGVTTDYPDRVAALLRARGVAW